MNRPQSFYQEEEFFWFCNSDLRSLSDQQNKGFTFPTIAQMAESREPQIPEFWLLKLRDSKSSKSGTPYICHPLSPGHAAVTNVPAFSVTSVLAVWVHLPVCTWVILDGWELKLGAMFLSSSLIRTQITASKSRCSHTIVTRLVTYLRNSIEWLESRTTPRASAGFVALSNTEMVR